MTAVIMQPTYLPWHGYFDLMDTADVFVFLDTVQFDKQSWQQRNQIKSGKNQSRWLTVPVVQEFKQKINGVKINNFVPWRRKHWGTLGQYYKRATYWKEYKDGLEAIYSQSWVNLIDLNIALIGYLKERFGINTKLVMASKIPVSGEKVSLLTNICHYLKADTYLSPVGSTLYIEENNIFESEGIALLYQRYKHPVYTQLFGDFLPQMSSIDLLLNEGPNSLQVIRSGRQKYDVAIMGDDNEN